VTRFFANFQLQVLERDLEHLAQDGLSLPEPGKGGADWQELVKAMYLTGHYKYTNADGLMNALLVYRETKWSPNGKGASRSLVVEQSSQVVQKKLLWIWKNWLPLRKITMLDGDPDVGKSTLTIDIAARITTGRAMPDGTPGVKGDVIFLSEEDDADDTITWRLDAAGADREHVFHVHATKDADGECPITIPDDLDLLEEEVKSHETKLVVIDVLDEYLAEKVDSYKNQSMRRVLRLLRGLASRNDVAIICLRHFRKEATDKAIHRGGGSIGIIGAARAGWALAYHPDDDSVRVLARQKGNLSVQAQKALTFKLRPWGQDSDYAYVDWTGETDLGADQLLSPPNRSEQAEADESDSALDYAKKVVVSLLPRPDVELWVKDFNDEADAAGVKGATLLRARSALKVQPKQYRKPDKEAKMGWKVWLPTSSEVESIRRSLDPAQVESLTHSINVDLGPQRE
jgi:hypothetical protein